MRPWKLYVSLCYLAASLVFWPGCTLDEPGHMDTTPALELRVEQNLSLITLHWDPVKVTGFKEYIILQSENDIPNRPEPEVSSSITVIKRIDQADVSSFQVPVSAFTTLACYKLYCAVEDRFLYSTTVCIDQPNISFNGFNDRAAGNRDLGQIVLYDRINDQMTLFDYKAQSPVTSAVNTELNFPQLSFASGDPTYIYAYDQTLTTLYQYQYPSLAPGASYFFSSSVQALAPYRQFLLVSVEDFLGKYFKILDRNTLSIHRSTFGMSGLQNIAVFDGDPATVYLLGFSTTQRLLISASGDILSDEPLPIVLSQPQEQFRTAQGQDLFIGGRLGTLLTRSGEFKGSLASGLNTTVLFARLSPDEEEVAYLVNDIFSTHLEIADISQAPLITVKHSYVMPELNFSELIFDTDRLYVIGTFFTTSLPQTLLLQFPR